MLWHEIFLRKRLVLLIYKLKLLIDGGRSGLQGTPWTKIERIGLDISAFGNLTALQGYLMQVFEVKGVGKLRYKDSEGDWIDVFAKQDLKLVLKTRQDSVLHIKLNEHVKSVIFDEAFLANFKKMKQTCETLIEAYEKLKKTEKENVSRAADDSDPYTHSPHARFPNVI